MNKKKPLVSIIIRSKNEEKWIDSCLRSIFNQKFKNFEVLLIDNFSKDNTKEIATKYEVKVLNIKKYKPGLAINKGVIKSSGSILVILSAHCIPTNNNWLSNLIKPLKDKNIAGVYGRQEPLSYSSDIDKRDLINTFGLDKIVQKKDPFFHNANSALLKSIWKKFKFNEKVDSLEDRVWGQNVIDAGYKIIYEPQSSVYHYHGINQNLNPIRLKNVIKTLSQYNFKKIKTNNLKKSKVICIIPIVGKSLMIDGKFLMERVITDALKSKLVNKVFVATNNYETAALAKKFGADTSFLRTQNMSEDFIGENELLKYILEEFAKRNEIFDIVVSIKETYPFRNYKIIDKMIKKLFKEKKDTIIAVRQERKSLWKLTNNLVLQPFEQNFVPRKLKTQSSYLSLAGLCYVTRADVINNKNIFNENTGFFKIKNIIETLEYSELKYSKKNLNKLLNIF